MRNNSSVGVQHVEPLQIIVILLLLMAFNVSAQRIYDGSGRFIGRVDSDKYYDGNKIYDGSGRFIARAEGLTQKQIVLFFYFYF